MQTGQACQSQCKAELDISLSRTLGKSGLGNSLSQCMNPGLGYEQGSGMGSGAGGNMSGQSGPAGGGFAVRGPHAYVPSLASMHGTGGGRRDRKQNRIAGTPTGLAPENIELMQNPAKKPPRASDAAAGRFPPEYRRLINDYFIAVSREKR